MRVLVLGATGQLGSDLVRTHPGHALTALGRDDLDLTDTVALGRAVSAARPDWVLNAAADNRTEAAEDNPDAAFAVNARAVRALVASCAAAGARLLQFSTDFVFDGRKGAPYVESDAPNPVNAYGRSKHEGERFVLAAGPAHLVVRSAGLFGRAGSRAKGREFRRRHRGARPAGRARAGGDGHRHVADLHGGFGGENVGVDRPLPPGGVFIISSTPAARPYMTWRSTLWPPWAVPRR
jgi:dTDP-4-dehydrorhamnose reductase